MHRAGPDDAARVRTVRLRALADSPDAFWTTWEQDRDRPMDTWRARLEAPGVATFLAVREGADIGLVVGSPHHEVDGEAGLYAIWVAPEARRTGGGRALVEAVLAWAREAGYPRVRLEVADGNTAAVAAYAALGFVPTGRTGNMPAPRTVITEHELSLDLTA